MHPMLRLKRLAAVSLCLLPLAVACADPAPTSSDVSDHTETERAAWVRAELDANNSQLSDPLRERKFEKMSESAFTFYRGSNHLFWADLADDERLERYGNDKDTRTWVQGDLHINNFGSFHADDGRVVYDLNDFDEAFIADYQHDVWRAAVSLVLVARKMGYSEDDSRVIVDSFAEAYLDALKDYRDSGAEKDFVLDKDNAYGKLDDFLEDVELGESRDKMLNKWTTVVDGARTLNTEYKKLGASGEELVQQISDGWAGYGGSLSGGLDFDPDYFSIKSVADRLDAGIGSLGTPRYYVLIEGPTTSPDDDIILDVKQASEPTGARYLNGTGFDDEAERSITAQKALGVNVDDHIGVIALGDGSYTVRERSPYKETFEAEVELTSTTRFNKLAEQWGLVLATDHARSDEDFDAELLPKSFEDEVHQRTNGEHDEFRELVWSVASSYAVQVERDYQTFQGMLR
jgi:uncharacterized protein (DUF2252 family)